ncbi:hypothetical protein [Coleofasciculus sp.]|uniref:hypothetical protein n=1 Tax=Coleofasciculus sp. TaxID=3100458 RepID=UPI0039FAA740
MSAISGTRCDRTPYPQTPPAAIAPECDIPRNGTVSAGRMSTHLFHLIIWESNEVNRTSH